MLLDRFVQQAVFWASILVHNALRVGMRNSAVF
jgi:hypothetical protein